MSERWREALLSDGADDLIRFMAAQSVALAGHRENSAAKEQAAALGWIDPATGLRTTDGFFASDSCREYLFWCERDRKLPFEGALPFLNKALFDGKVVCEVGAGMGANLMSLAQMGADVRGVEPVETYITLGDILREKEKHPKVAMQVGSAETLPFEDGALDLVLVVTAHQYFRIQDAFAEIARVLKPGGELVLLGGTLGPYAKGVGRKVLRGQADLKSYVITILNTVGYAAMGRRLIPSRSGFTTSRPVYPPERTMTRLLKEAGFDLMARPAVVHGEKCFYARRSA